MLNESFIASLQGSGSVANHAANKDVGIYIYDYLPLFSLISTFKQSSTDPHCLAVSQTHVFAAQSGKAVVHVYNRERGNQETIVPFPEKTSSLALVSDWNGSEILALGTEGGGVLLWELCTGRLISTPQSHLQATTCMAIDPTSNFLLTGSPDSNIHVWSLPALLSFSSFSSNRSNQSSQYAPLRTVSSHRAAITAIVSGHSSSGANIAVSGSQDNTCVVWDYRTGNVLHTFLLLSMPISLALDPADRALYAGYDDGSIQLIDFYKPPLLSHLLHDMELCATPTQPDTSDRWILPAGFSSAALCLAVSYDGTSLISGHHNGRIQSWDVAKGCYNTQLADFPAAITNLKMLLPTGFPSKRKPTTKSHNIFKPHYESSINSGNLYASDGLIPENYTFITQFTSGISHSGVSSPQTHDCDPVHDFDAAISHSSFPKRLLEEGIITLNTPSIIKGSSLSDNTEQNELQSLRTQLDKSQESHRQDLKKVMRLEKELLRKYELEKLKKRAKQLRRIRKAKVEEVRRKIAMGEKVIMDIDSEAEAEAVVVEGVKELSSSTPELSESD